MSALRAVQTAGIVCYCVSLGSTLHVARRLAPLLGLDEALEERLLLVCGQAQEALPVKTTGKGFTQKHKKTPRDDTKDDTHVIDTV
jgi:hypothetical protein